MAFFIVLVDANPSIVQRLLRTTNVNLFGNFFEFLRLSGGAGKAEKNERYYY